MRLSQGILDEHAAETSVTMTLQELRAIAERYLRMEEALQQIARPQIQSITPRDDGNVNVVTVEYKSWDAEIATQALSFDPLSPSQE